MDDADVDVATEIKSKLHERTGHVSVLYENSIYVWGGYSVSSTQYEPSSSSRYLAGTNRCSNSRRRRGGVADFTSSGIMLPTR